jgi:hypothetical protein
MNATKIVILLLVLAVIGGGVYLVTSGGGPRFGPPQPVEEPTPEPQMGTPPTPDAVAVNTPPTTDPGVGRTEVTHVTPSGREYAQGVRGRVVDMNNVPVPAVDVYLMEGHGKDIFSVMLMAQRGVVIPPVAHAVSDDRGQFQLGLQQALDSKTFELRLVSDRYSDQTVQNLTIFESKWYDAGDIRLERGVAVHGRVTVQGSTGLPVPNSQVSVKVTSAFPSVSPTPGRERGIVVVADAGGYYRLDNVAPGMVTVAAVAPGFAKIERTNVQVTKETDNQVDFELPKGMSIGGIVTDGDGNVLAGAKITAIAISSKTPLMEEARSGQDGRFEILGLTDGPYQLTAVAQGFCEKQVKPVLAGATDEQVVLERQGGIRVRVSTRGGRLLTRFDVVLKRYFKEQDTFSNVPNAQVHRVFQANLEDGAYRMTGIDPETYVVEVNANGYAKTFSDPFSVTLGGDEQLVEVTMKEGGEIRGTLIGYDGRPLEGATITTLPNFLDENPFTAMFGAMIPYKISKTWTTSDTQGRYSLKLLAPGEYQLKFTHPTHYDVYEKGYKVEEGQVTEIQRLQLDRGTIVTGTVRVDGAPAGQVKVSISSTADATNPTKVGFSAEAITDNEGQFTIQKRVPPGQYQARAARQTLPSPLMQVVDFAKTQQDFTLARGQESFTLHFNIQDN